MTFVEVFLEYKFVILFYLAIILFIYLKRKKFEFQAKFIALYRMKFGLGWIEKVGRRHSELIKILGYCGIGVGYAGMAFIVFMLGKGLWDMAFVPNAPPVVSPVLPGVPIPGSPIFVPFWYGIIALFIVVVIHEFSHGVVARAHDVKVMNTGIVFFGPIVGAFVEPDEKQVDKQPDHVKYSIFAAGPFSNVLTAALVLLIAALVMSPLTDAVAKPVGVEFTYVEPGFPADIAGLQTGVTYDFVNNYSTNDLSSFESALRDVQINETVYIGNSDSNYTVVTTSREENPKKAIIGVNVRTKFTNEDKWWLKIILWTNGLLSWIFMLSLGLGLANLLPLGPVDGGRMIKESLERIWGEKVGKQAWYKITVLVIVILLILVFVPIARAILGPFFGAA
ncbi:site-2 protease family protein [Candidatus Woesearchaeota archaeon]|nr:site-2 protease family protein [Candidatus Woesearchaeota archaeon]